jgi:transcriptional regulator GlxA family with amidase domain
MLASSVSLPLEMWQAADQHYRGRQRVARRLQLYMFGPEGSGSPSGLLDLTASHSLNEVPLLDVLYLPALWRDPGRALSALRLVLPWLSEQVDNLGTLVAATGTGVCVLAETGRLDGQAATTHWYYFDRFAERYPRVDLKREYFITQAGRLHCAAGINALSDVTVHFIERLYGRAAADHVERTFAHEIRRGYSQRSFYSGLNQRHPDELISEAQQWIHANLDARLRIRDIARRFELSERSFNRRFRIAADVSPHRYLQTLRVDTARELLQASNLTIGEIAFKVGFQDQRHFARVFRRQLGVNPSEYRRTVRAKLFSVPVLT